MSTSACALRARHLSLQRGGRTVLEDVNLEIVQGRWTVIVGPNGAGKSSLLMALAGLLPGDGVLEWSGRPLSQWPTAQRGRTLAWLGQSHEVSSQMRVHDLVMLGRLPHRRWLAPPSAHDLSCVERALRQVQAWDWRDRRFDQLSGGEQQRVLLARAWAVEASIVLMDEPLANLDPPHQVDWVRQVREQVSQGVTVVTVLHELSLALQADDMVVMSAGHVRHHGTAQEPLTHAALSEVFEGRVHIERVGGEGPSGRWTVWW